jgi:hypothetical protein
MLQLLIKQETHVTYNCNVTKATDMSESDYVFLHQLVIETLKFRREKIVD